MTRAKLHVYIEGHLPDSYLYEKVIDDVCDSQWDYRVIRPRELPEGYNGDGKKCLVGWYRFLRRYGLLQVRFKSRKAAALFFFDKDVDDLRRTRCRSEHVVYTDYYDIENHLFRCGDLVDSVAATLSLGRRTIESVLGGTQDQWLASAAERWKDWVKLSLAARLSKARYAGYRIASKVNPTPADLADPALVNAERQLLRSQLGWTSAAFEHFYNRVGRKVDAAYHRKEHDKVFKGKWYAVVLEDDIKKAGLANRCRGSFSDHLVMHLAQSLEPDGLWAAFIRRPAEKLLAECA